MIQKRIHAFGANLIVVCMVSIAFEAIGAARWPLLLARARLETMAVERKYWTIEHCPFHDMCSKASWQRVGKCVSYESPDHSRDFWFLKSLGPGNG